MKFHVTVTKTIVNDIDGKGKGDFAQFAKNVAKDAVTEVTLHRGSSLKQYLVVRNVLFILTTGGEIYAFGESNEYVYDGDIISWVSDEYKRKAKINWDGNLRIELTGANCKNFFGLPFNASTDGEAWLEKLPLAVFTRKTKDNPPEIILKIDTREPIK